LDAVELVEGRTRIRSGQRRWQQICDAMFVRLGGEELDDRLRIADFIFFLVVPENDVGQIRAAEVAHKNDPQKNSCPASAASGKGTRENHQQHAAAQREEQNGPADLPETERYLR